MTYPRDPAGGSQPTASGTRRSNTQTGVRNPPPGGGWRQTASGTRRNCTQTTFPRVLYREVGRSLSGWQRIRPRNPGPRLSPRTVRTQSGVPIRSGVTSFGDSSSACPRRWSSAARSLVTTQSERWLWRPMIQMQCQRSAQRRPFETPAMKRSRRGGRTWAVTSFRDRLSDVMRAFIWEWPHS